MATVTKTTVAVTIGEYTYGATLDGNRAELFRDGVFAGHATWGGKSLEDFPKELSTDAHDALDAAIRANLHKAWRAASSDSNEDDRVNALGPRYQEKEGALTPDAANRGQMGNEPDKPARQGEKEVGVGGPGRDPQTGEIGGQAIKPHRRAAGDGRSAP